MTSASADQPDHSKQQRIGLARLALVAMVIIWGINFPVSKAALGEFAPLPFNALRFSIASIVLLIALLGRGLSWPAPRDRLRVLLLGLFGNVVYQQFFIFGLDRTRAGTASILLASTPLLTAVLSSLVGHEKLAPQIWIGACATVAGIALVVLLGGDASAGDHSLIGDLLMMGASISWAVFTVGSRPLVERYGAVPFTAWTLWVGTCVLLPIGLPGLSVDHAAVTNRAWFGVLYAGTLSIGIAYLIWYYGVRQLGNTRTAVFGNLVPVVALLAAWLHLDEVPQLGQLLGAAVIIGGVTLVQARPRGGNVRTAALAESTPPLE